MLCLGIETSCDETAVALFENGRPVLEKLASQADLHAVFGGVVPELASREHLRRLGPLLLALFAESGRSLADVDVIAVARGPGLLGSLLVGLAAAKGLSLATGKPLIGVDHLHAHLLAATIGREVPFPALGLLVSGGHTQIVRLDSALSLEVLGRTLDDAAGEAFDKAAKSFNLPYPGGVYIDVLGRGIAPDKTLFPRPFLDNDHLDFSFSGLKTAVASYAAAHPELRAGSLAEAGGAIDPEAWPMALRRACSSLNFAIADTLRIKFERALDRPPGPPASLIAAGGVAANGPIRAMLADLAARRGLPLYLPEPALCADNAVMVAAAGSRLAEAGYAHDLTLTAVPRGRKVPWDYVGGPSGKAASVDSASSAQ
ncbi:tRNA (adenosine(37)-N6)-threonylcarbamoyltransferase complex transferase subunit TsaD [Solidesulfovibrio carbinolicus]|uniref:tRNA N6-adenosine threonylcarbamoyltransferase n=1 Tax=Solidesulfovibrio carbinolicus TaxID=296842 RepID=A0A4P6I1F3_9BACT|nr:tRNA (adenosine(37)-N6)-threonylcarbamoyltransferase complex transferase subunit TsaD [Solidesulfovibrio carbinolicus]QAZ67609.1 tRNA (adenosine(37)-N6)-threonylcarbamoyltransferase complex transferase subunit TsaD [Solidesulfovibrio carbinolicus]